MDYRFENRPVLPVVEAAVAAMDSFAGQAGVRLAFEAGKGASSLRADIDRDRITQVLTNLLSNAIKFSDKGGEVLTFLDGDADRLRVTVVDHGAGIPAAFRERIFQRFAQADGADSRRNGGTGLGLSICKTIVEEHGGRIWFESEEGEGTRFFVELPALPAINDRS
jgi:signal transduction histidine kinase